MEPSVFQYLLAFAYLFFGATVGCFGFVLMPPILGHWVIRLVTGMLFGSFLVSILASGMESAATAGPALFAATLMVAGWLAGWVHLPVRRWWYHLTPHPAERAVVEATVNGAELDAATIESLGLPVSTGDPFRDEVLADQARELTRRWRASEARLAEEEARILAAEAARLEKQNELLEAQHALAEAALAHEKRAARVAELQRQQSHD